MHTGQILRTGIIILLLCVAGRVGRWSYQVLMDLFSLQLTMYKRILTSQETLSNGQEQLTGLRDSALELLGKEQHSTSLPTDTVSLEEQLLMQANKRKTIAGSIAAIIGVVVWKILFDIVFGVKKTILRMKEFIN